MSNTKGRKKLNDTTFAIRLPQAIRDQLEVIAHAQYKSSSEIVRDMIVAKVREAQPYIHPQQAAALQAQAQQVGLTNKFNPSKFKTPAEQKAWEDTWDY